MTDHLTLNPGDPNSDRVYIAESRCTSGAAFIRLGLHDAYAWLSVDETRAVRDKLTEILGDAPTESFEESTRRAEEDRLAGLEFDRKRAAEAPELAVGSRVRITGNGVCFGPYPRPLEHGFGLDEVGVIVGRSDDAAYLSPYEVEAGGMRQFVSPCHLEPDHGSRVFVKVRDYVHGGAAAAMDADGADLGQTVEDGDSWGKGNLYANLGSWSPQDSYQEVVGYDLADFHPAPEPLTDDRRSLEVGDVIPAEDVDYWIENAPEGTYGRNWYGVDVPVESWLRSYASYTVTRVGEEEPEPEHDYVPVRGDRIIAVRDTESAGGGAIPKGTTGVVSKSWDDGFIGAPRDDWSGADLFPRADIVAFENLTSVPSVGDRVVVIDGGGSTTTPHYPTGHVGTVREVWPVEDCLHWGNRIVIVSGLDSGIFARRLGRVLV